MTSGSDGIHRQPAGLAGLVGAAVKAVPALRYALAVGGLAVLVALAAGFFDLRVAAVGTIVVLLLVILLIAISRLAEDRGNAWRWASYILVYFSIAAMVVAVALFMVTFFVRPEILRDYLHLNSFYQLMGIQPSEAVLKRNASNYISEFDDAVTGAATPAMVAEALERTAAFWRQPAQREILRKYRCGDPSSTIIFAESAKYVFAEKSLMKDIDTISRYYDGVARCVLASECDPAEICRYFGQQMQDFQRQYTTYFREIRILEGYDPMSNIRQVVFKRCEAENSTMPKAEKPQC